MTDTAAPGTVTLAVNHEGNPIGFVPKAALDYATEQHAATGRALDNTRRELGDTISRQAQRIADLEAQVAAAKVESESTARTLANLREQIGKARREADAYKTTVRDRIIQAQKEHDLCKDGTNAVLDDLGLDRLSTKFAVEVKVTGYQTVTVYVDAEDAEDAEAKVKDGEVDVDDHIEAYHWEDYEYEVEDVQAED